MSPTLTEVEELARRAGSILKAGFGTHLQVDYKGVIDPVTEMDRRSEDLIVGEIRSRFPRHAVVAEESGSLGGDASQRWYIDPLDGTVNYAHGLPLFAVSIAYAEAGQLQLGVVYEPMRDECYSARRGAGARLNGTPIRVSTTPDLDHSLVVTGFPYDIRTNPNNNLDNYARFSLITQAVRRLGSAALDLVYVAAGRLDGFWEIRLKSWDVAAGALIVQEAGGVVSDLAGGPDFLAEPQSILAANPALHPLMVKKLNQPR